MWGEKVILDGTAHFVFHESVASDGSIHSHVHLNHQHTEGIGVTTGDKYTFHESDHQTFNLNHDGTVFHATVTGTLIHNGKPTNTASNSLITMALETVLDADGIPKTFVQHVDIRCPGT